MKNLKYILFVLVVGFVFTSCYKEESFVDKNTKDGGKYFPVIQTLSVTNVPDDGTFVEGELAKLSLTYFSIDDVQNIEVFYTAEDSEVPTSFGYVYSYDADAAAEVQVMDYVIPAGTSGLELPIRVVVNTKQGLSKEASTTITVE